MSSPSSSGARSYGHSDRSSWWNGTSARGEEKRRQGAGGVEAGPTMVTTTFGTGSEGAGTDGTDDATVGKVDGEE